MNFKRSDVQEYIEAQLNCYDKSRWTDYKPSLEKWIIKEENLPALNRCIKSDLNSYYLKALQTFSQAVDDISQNNFSWAIIKLYYSCFFLLRCDILLSDYITVRCKKFYTVKVQKGKVFESYKANGRGDHEIVLEFCNQLFSEGELRDPLFGNTIDEKSPYEWMKLQRERVNYKIKDFKDPYPDPIFNHIYQYFKRSELKKLFQFYLEDESYALCFDQDHSILAIPFRKLVQINQKMRGRFDLSPHNLKKYVSCLILSKKLDFSKTDLIVLDHREEELVEKYL